MAVPPLIITVAAVGAELTRDEQPGLPITPEELATDAAECAEAGASIYHLHVRDEAGAPTMDVDTFRAAKEAIESSADVIVQFTSGGAVSDEEDARVAPLDLRPEMASLTTGTVNFGDGVFWNPPELIERLYRTMRSVNVLPEFEIFEPGMIATAERLCAASGDDHHRHFDFVLGVPGAMPAWDDAVDFLAAHVPKGASWGATGVGRSHLAVTKAAIAGGGHVRTGLEDVRYFAAGELVSSNAQLIRRVAEMGREMQREIATPSQARALLGL
ncbi:MAG: 3-keto-5-aminohexanoate cleavage enzyme [Actinomycetota bacterium]|nr:3-keto-5-aminohexanoate cleavage enzyme [Actinomycetota bacterium]